jgi:hypothetical protein
MMEYGHLGRDIPADDLSPRVNVNVPEPLFQWIEPSDDSDDN